MKKISIISVLTLLAMPAIAEQANVASEITSTHTNMIEYGENALIEAPLTAEQPKQMDFVEPIVPAQETYRNPKTKFPRGLQLGIGVSPTSGLNGFIGYNNKNFDSFWAKRFGIRFDFATFSPIKNKLNTEINEWVGEDGIKIDDGLKINNMALNGKHIGAMVDFYPFGDTWFLGGWRVSGGYFTGNLEAGADISAKNNGGHFEFELGDNKFYYEGDMKGLASVNWKYSGPYVGTGFDLGLVFGLKLYFDAGVVFTDKVADLSLDVPVDGLKHQGSGTDVTQSELDAAVDKTLADARKELDKYPYFPLVKIGVMYRF